VNSRTAALVAPDVDVEVRGGTWYAVSLPALLESPKGLPASVLSEMRAWYCRPDENVRTGRPFAVLYEADERTRYGRHIVSFDWYARRRRAPRWWVDAAERWSAAYDRDNRGAVKR
jgi:hypothetical protein